MFNHTNLPFTPDTSLEQLQDHYDNLLKEIDMDNPRTRIISQAKLLTTSINSPDIQAFEPDCREICRKIKALTEVNNVVQ